MSEQSLPLVSVVLPVYNVQKYLDECIESVASQSYAEIEIIVVDDGSTDSSGVLCDTWAKKDPRIKVIHKANQGLGMARNSGLEAALGKYVCFFDGDDYVDPGVIEAWVRSAESNDADVVVSGYRSVSPGGAVLEERIPSCPEMVFRGRDVSERFLPYLIGDDLETADSWGLTASACCALYKRSVLVANGHRFASERDIIAEDVYFSLGLYRYVDCVVVLNKAFYNYRVNQASLTHTFRSDRLEKIAVFYNESLMLAKESDYTLEVLNRLKQPYLNFTIAALKQIAVSDKPYREKRETVHSLCQDATFSEVLDCVDVRKLGLNKAVLLQMLVRGHVAVVLLLCSVKAGRR